MLLYLNNDDNQTQPMDDQIKQLMDQLLPVFNSGNPDESLKQIMDNLSRNMDSGQILGAMDQLKKIISQSLGSEIDLNSLNLNQIQGLVNKCGDNLKKYKIVCKKDDFEPYSVNTANLYNYLIADGSVTSELINSGLIDVSGPLLYLGNIIEYELNASIGQAMRMILLDIDMPDYYMRLYPYNVDDDFTVRAGRNYVDLNKIYENPVNQFKKLATCTIGDLCFAFNNMLEDFGDDDPDLEIIPEKLRQKDQNGHFFTFDFVRFGNLRNRAAHAGEVDMDVFDNAFKLYSRIVDEYMPAIAELKSRLKTPPQN